MYAYALASRGGIPVYTASSAPRAAAAGARSIIRVSDLNNSEWISDGTYWRPNGGEQLVYAPDDAAPTGSGTITISFSLPAKFLAPNMTVWQSHKTVKTGTASSITQALKLNTTQMAYSTAMGTTILASRCAALLTAGTVSGGNLTFTSSLPGTTSAETGTSPNAVTTFVHAIASALPINYTAITTGDTTGVQAFKIAIRG